MPDMAEHDSQALLFYLQPRDPSEDLNLPDGWMEEGGLTHGLDSQDPQSDQTIPFDWETEADNQLFEETDAAYHDGTYNDVDASEEKGKGRAVEPQANAYGGAYIEAQYQDCQAPFVGSYGYQYQHTEPSNGFTSEYLPRGQPDYAPSGYVHASSEGNPSFVADSAFSLPHVASSSASAFTAAGQISSRSIRTARKPASRSTAPPKEKKPVKQSKKKSLAEVRYSETSLLWRPSPDQQWIPAVYHNDIWNELLEWTDRFAATQGGYDYPPAKGIENWNRTAFCLAQKDWARDRDSRPDVLFYIQKTDVGEPPKPQDFFWNTRRVIDRDNLGMRWFDDLPATISSAVEDFRLDAIQKLNPNIEWEDIWGRTPNEFRTGKEPGIRTRSALTVPALSNRTLRFRREAGTLAWDRKDEIGNEIALEFFRDLMGEDCIRDNNTFAFGRDLRPEEVDRLDEYLRVEKLPERAQARRRATAARAAAKRQTQPGPSNRQNVQQAPSVYHNAQQPAVTVQPPQASIQRVLQPSANGSSQSYPREPSAQSGRTGQGSSSRFGASRFRQGFGATVPSTCAFNPTNPAYGAPNQHGKRSFDDTHDDRQSAATAKRPRVINPGSIDQVTPEFNRDSGQPQLVQPRPFNPLKRSNVLSPYSRARGAQMQGFNNYTALTSTNNAYLGGHANNASHKRVRQESDEEEEEEGNSTQYKKPRIEQPSASQASGTRRVRRPAQRFWRPSTALAKSVGALVGSRAAPRAFNGSESNDYSASEPRDSHTTPYAAEVAPSTGRRPPNNGYMDITVSVPVGSEIVVKPRNQTYNLVGMAIPGQNIDWKVVDRVASAASRGAESPMPAAEQEEYDPDWQGRQTTARSSKYMGNDHLPRAANPHFNGNVTKTAANDSGPPPGLPEDFVEEGFEPDGYEDAVQYQDQIQLDNIDLSSSTVGAPFDTAQYPNQFQLENLDFSSSTLGAPLDMTPPGENHQYGPPGTQVTGDTNVPDFEDSASSPYFGGNLAGTPEIDYFSQFQIPHYSADELDDILGKAADNSNSSSTIDPNTHAEQALTEAFAFPQANTLGTSASGFSGLTYGQMQAEYEDTFGRPLFNINYPLGDDIFGDINNVEFPLDYPIVQLDETDIPQITVPSPSGEEVRDVPGDGGYQGQAISSSPTLGAASGLTAAQLETPATTIPSDPPRAPQASTDLDPATAPQASDPQEPDWDELFGEDYDKV